MSAFVLRDSSGKTYPVTSAIRLGRESTSTIIVSDPSVSRAHATVWGQGDTLLVRDENSSNGTFVNGTRIGSAQPMPLRAGDQLRVGKIVFSVERVSVASPASQQPPAKIRAGGGSALARAPANAPSGGGLGRFLIAGCIVLFVLCGVVAVGGFLAVRSGAITQRSLLNLVGLGPAQIEVDNFRDDAIQVTIQQTDAAQDSSAAQGSLRLNAFDVKSFTAPNGGKYRVTFAATLGNAVLGTCALTLRGGDHYQFVALPERIAVNRNDAAPARGADFIIQTSALCR